MAHISTPPVTAGLSFPSYARKIIGMRVHVTDYESATRWIIACAASQESKAVFVANVHMVMEAYDHPEFQEIVNKADLITPDGVPLVWSLKMFGERKASRVYGPDLTLYVCKAAAAAGISIGLYGGTPESLSEFSAFLEDRFPGIRVGCKIAPPFRPLSVEEDEAYTRQIIESGVGILFVGIGCPKQERWINAHRDRIPAVILGVGAAFDFHSGRVRQAPDWMQAAGLEWLFRLLMEPRRLWKRYAVHNPRFLLLMAYQLITGGLIR